MRLFLPSRLLLALALTVSLALAGTMPARAEIGDLTSLVLTPLTPGNEAISRAGVQRGRGMERESLGMAVKAGAIIEARVANGVADVALALMTDNHETDVESGNGYQPADTRLPTDGTWRRITAVGASGVFARTKAWPTAPRIEYRLVSGAAFEMPAYRLGDSQAQFVAAWQSSGSPFAVIVDRSFTMLIPRVDLPKVSDMAWSHFADLDDVIGFYRLLMSTYDDWLGVSDTDPSPLHRNATQSPFMRPDRTGWGLAYYSGGRYIGTNVGSVDYYLAGPASWLILHEIGHGYDGIMTSAAAPDDIQLGEVWNNVYGYQYQTLVNGLTSSNWLNETSKPADQQRRDDSRRRAGGAVRFNQLGYQDKLDFVARIADLTGPEGFRTFNRSLRELQATPGFTTWPARKDLIAQRWGGAQGYNLVPWFEAYSLPVSDSVAEDLYDVRQLPIALPLSDLFDNASQARSAATQLRLDSPGALVSSARTATLGNRGAVRVTATTASPADIEGRIVSLWRGDTEVATAPFFSGVANFTGIPLGALTVRFPLSLATGVVPQRQGVAVRQSAGASAVTVSYPAAALSPSLNGSLLTLRGLGDAAFASVEHDPVAATITINDTLTAPHSYFSSEYANIRVSTDGKSLFERSFVGDKRRTGPPTTTVPAAPGTTITITHLEPSRVIETNPTTGYPRPALNATEPTTTWRVTELGLVKVDDSGNWDEGAAARDHLDALTASLANLAATVAENPGARLSSGAASLRIAIEHLPGSADRLRLVAEYGSLLATQIALADRPTPTPTPTPTPSATSSPTPTPSPSASASSVPSPTPSGSATATSTPTATTKPPVTPKPTATTKPSVPPIAPPPFDVYSTPGHHTVNGRQWFTQCEAYSQTQRCRTEIWGTTVTYANGAFVQKTGWQFNNLTYLASPRSMWAGKNRLGYTNGWTATDGRQWRTECDTPVTGRNGCRSWTMSQVVQANPAPGGGSRYSIATVEVFNNIVRFS